MTARTLHTGRWTTKDLRILRDLYPKQSTAKVAHKLGRKPDAVKKQASRLGIYKAKA